MNERIAKTGIAAVVLGALAFTGLTLTIRIESFAPCRVPYRLPRPVQDSLACHVYSALGVVSLLFLIAAAGAGLVAIILAFFKRADPPNP